MIRLFNYDLSFEDCKTILKEGFKIYKEKGFKTLVKETKNEINNAANNKRVIVYDPEKNTYTNMPESMYKLNPEMANFDPYKSRFIDDEDIYAHKR